MSIIDRFSNGKWQYFNELTDKCIGSDTSVEVKPGNREYSLRVLIDKYESMGMERRERAEMASEYWRGFEQFTVDNPPELIKDRLLLTAYNIERERHSAERAENYARKRVDGWQNQADGINK